MSGNARTGGKDVTLEDVKLRGERLSFRLAGRTYSARVRGAALEGEIAGGGGWSAKRAR